LGLGNCFLGKNKPRSQNLSLGCLREKKVKKGRDQHSQKKKNAIKNKFTFTPWGDQKGGKRPKEKDDYPRLAKKGFKKEEEK